MEIKKGRMTVIDTKDNLIETEEGITCGCEKPSLRMVSHMDGKDFYNYQYQCSCGNSIYMECKRDEEDLMYWSD